MNDSEAVKQAFAKLGLLKSVRVLICRPEPSATDLANALEAMGAQCQILPMLNIEPVEISAAERQNILDLDQYQRVVVVSQHAAKLGLEHIDTYWPQAPVQQKWYAIGRKTAEALQAGDMDIASPDQDMSSEKLLENAELQSLEGEKVLILKGKQGRDTLEKALSDRGAHVDSVSFYERSRPDYDKQTLKQHTVTFSPDYIIALSGETLSNLIAHCREHNIDLSDRSFILSSTRVANIAYEHGLKQVFVPDNLMPMDIVRCIKKAG